MFGTYLAPGHVDFFRREFELNKFSGINANSEQSLEVWNRTRKIINEMNTELGQGELPKNEPAIKKIIIQPDPNEPNESTSLD